MGACRCSGATALLPQGALAWREPCARVAGPHLEARQRALRRSHVHRVRARAVWLAHLLRVALQGG